MHFPRATCITVVSILTTGCASASGGVGPAAFPGAPVVSRPTPVSPGPIAPLDLPRLLQTALALQGTPYLLGGETPSTGFDCSGLVRFLFRDQGWELPRTVREQWDYGRKIREREIQAGDLLFFHTESRGASHVGIAIDPAQTPDGRSGPAFVHAPAGGGVVRVDVLESPYWRSRFLGARRLF